MVNMIFAPQPIVARQFGMDTMKELPEELQKMLITIKSEYARGFGVTSLEHKVSSFAITLYHPSLVLTCVLPSQAAWPDNIFDTKSDYNFADPTLLPGPSPTPQLCAKLVRLARRCEENRACEAAWNSSVHNLILDTALDNDAFVDSIYFVNWLVLPPHLRAYHRRN
jgi:hypothetical protein